MKRIREKIVITLGHIFSFAKSKIEGWILAYNKTKFNSIGKNTAISYKCHFTYATISIGDFSYIGPYCIFQSVHGEIEIGNHVMFGPGVHIHGGNHVTNKIGFFMNTVTKEAGSDGKVIIEDDVWVGANAIILKGVTIGEGAVVAAGSIVIKNVQPYSIVAGSPAKIIKMRFTENEINEHKKLLNGSKK